MKIKSPKPNHNILIASSLATLLVASPLFANETNAHHVAAKTLRNFGPGDHYLHRMAINPADYTKVNDISHAASHLPKPLPRKQPETVIINLNTEEVIADIAPGISYHYWTFNKTVPGPFLRVRASDTVELNLHNDKSSSHSHAIDLHAVTGPGGGKAVTSVEPGETKTLVFKATTPGLYVYHCANGNAATHIANGMYGLILVEPKEGLAKVDHEFYLMQGELYTHGSMGKKGFQSFDGKKMLDESPEYIVFNGRTGALVGDGQLHAKVGDKIRLFIGNAGVAKIASFHVIGEIFDRVYPEAALNNPLVNVQTTLIPAGGASIVEFQVDYPGDYVLVDHALARIDRGAWGILQVTGAKDDALYLGHAATNDTHSNKH
ncbi:MAG: copper-containing nitrite reductase [Methyloprofundus sp.]|nr:copper-containing nitrite reductase [Methyloprofundus sp.]MDT8426246.1 copper-containing nitrite reductase [Methyloprofundus sp.]